MRSNSARLNGTPPGLVSTVGRVLHRFAAQRIGHREGCSAVVDQLRLGEFEEHGYAKCRTRRRGNTARWFGIAGPVTGLVSLPEQPTNPLGDPILGQRKDALNIGKLCGRIIIIVHQSVMIV
jgi:hypothetical protein